MKDRVIEINGASNYVWRVTSRNSRCLARHGVFVKIWNICVGECEERCHGTFAHSCHNLLDLVFVAHTQE